MHGLLGSPKWRLLWILVLGLSFTDRGAAQQFTYEKLHQFTNYEAVLAGPFVLGHDGNLYGTISGGSASNKGVIVRVSPGGVYKPLYNFRGDEGSYPQGTLVPDDDGSLYGVTGYGGTDGYDSGVVFRYSPDNKLTVLHRFTPQEGRYVSRLIKGPDEAFYGLAYYGGRLDGGSVFRITRDGQFSLLYSFSQEIVEGTRRAPNSPTSLILGSDGNLYGTTAQGGPIEFTGFFQLSYGVIFRLTLRGELTVLHEFTKDGPWNPNSLTEGPDGHFYGTSGSTNDSSGHVFRLSRDGAFSVLHTFPRQSGDVIAVDGQEPSGLISGKDGNLYGVTRYGGTIFYGGTVFRISTQGDFRTLHAFSDRSSGMPWGGVTEDENGSLYGFTCSGSINGSIYRLVRTESPVNHPPIAQPLTFTQPPGPAPLAIYLAFDATDPDGDLLGASIATQPQHGTASVEGRYLVYRPLDPNNITEDSFTYAVSDGRGGTASALVLIKVGTDDGNRPPVAPELAVLLQSEGNTRFSALEGATDPDNDHLGASIRSAAQYGSVEIDSDGIVTYWPWNKDLRDDSITVEITDYHNHTVNRLITLRGPVQGSFEGLLREDGSTNGRVVGQIRLHLQKSQTFSISLRIKNARYAFAGEFDFDGRYQTTIHGPDGSSELTLQAHRAGEESSIEVMLESTNATYAVTAELRRFRDAGALAGRYTMLLPAAGGTPGTGYATVLVRKNGSIRLVGKMGDDSPFSTGTELQGGGKFELFATTGNGETARKSVSGMIAFRRRLGVSDGHGSLVRYRASSTRGGGTFSQSALLSRYQPPAAGTLLSALGARGDSKTMLRLSGGAFRNTERVDVSPFWGGFYGTDQQVQIQNTFSPAVGLFRGSFIHHARRTQGFFSGVVFQVQQRAGGVFSSREGIGSIDLRNR